MPDGKFSAHEKRHSECDQLDLFRALPGDLPPCDAEDLMAYLSFRWRNSSAHHPNPSDSF
jgi:plasmid replication initiation protein